MSDPDSAHTPLTEKERSGLLLPLLTRDQLNIEELQNIAKARLWALRSKRSPSTNQVLSLEWSCRLHSKMFSDVWIWAGQFRITDKNIGVPYWQVRPDLTDAIEDCKAELDGASLTESQADRIVIRFAHRIVAIHPFPNGNGRWSRLYADVLISSLGFPVYTWGGMVDRNDEALRPEYIASLKRADLEIDYEPLISFARS